MIERRVKRSNRLETALEYQLEACAERAGLEAMVLADDAGLLVASSPWSSERSETIAAFLPLLVEGSDYLGILRQEVGDGEEPVLISAFEAAGSELFLCAVGGFGGATHQEIARAKVGVRRILN